MVYIRIETQRLIIRDFTDSDLEDYHNLTSNVSLAYKAGFKPHADRKTSLYQMQSIMLMHDYYAITLKDGTFIGDLNFYKDPVRRTPDCYQVGFLLDEPYWGKGYMQEALKAFITYLFLHHNIELLSCVTMIDNLKSQQTITNVGFNYDGIIKKYKKLYNGDIVDCKIYSMDQYDFERNEILWQKN